jgi:GNAT superfamily N-acetyltransferase
VAEIRDCADRDMGADMIPEEYAGSETHQRIQRRLRARHAEIAADPVLGNGGRVLNVLDPETFGWDRLVAEVEQDRFVALVAMERATIFDRIAAVFGPEIDTPCWDVFLGPADAVLTRCGALGASLPDGWRASSATAPEEATIAAVQALNAASGVAAMPAWYMRGEIAPQLTTTLHAPSGELAACALVGDRYHPDGPLAGTVFLGSVSVAPEHRGLGLGTTATARSLIDSHAAFGWTRALGLAAPDNPASRAMLQRCGLVRDPDRVTVVINVSGAGVTR